jgi:protein-disulfide isomerase
VFPKAIMTPVRAVLLNRIVLVLALVGVVIAGTLTYSHYANIIVPCGLASGCETVAKDASSKWFGIPVALYGLLAYLTIAGIASMRMFIGLEQTQRLGLLSYSISLVGAMVSLGLQIYSGTVIKAWCDWCIASAVTMVLVFIAQAALYQVLSGVENPEPSNHALQARKKGYLVVLGLAALLSIAALFVSGMITNKAGSGGKSLVLAETDIPKLVPDDANTKGPADAPITIVEFGDLCCPACQKAFAMLNDVYRQYNGKVRIVFRHFPLYQKHQQSFRAAVYSEYAATKGHFWDYLDRVYQFPPDEMEKKETFENALIGLSMDVGEAEKQFQSESSRGFERVYRDLQMADQLGIQVTPTFFIFAKGERPRSIQISEISSKLESDDKYRKLLGPGSG